MNPKLAGIPDLPGDNAFLDLPAQKRLKSLQELTDGRVLDLSASPHLKDSVIADGRNMEAAILFMDISGFTSRTGEMTPEQTAYFVNRFFKGVSHLLDTNGATVDKTIGDCLMLVFSPLLGCPEPLLSAVKLSLQVIEFDPHSYLPHIGLCTGNVWLGLTGHPNSVAVSVFGRPVNLAARLSGIKAAATAFGGQAETDYACVSMPSKDWDLVKDSLDKNKDDFGPEVRESRPDLKGIGEVEVITLRNTGNWLPSYSWQPFPYEETTEAS